MTLVLVGVGAFVLGLAVGVIATLVGLDVIALPVDR